MEPVSTSATELQYCYPEAMQVYGIVVDERLASAMIKVGLKALAGRKVDLLVFLCLAPHDISSRTDWNDILAHLPASNGKQSEYEIRMMQSPAELLYASLNMRVVRLPVDFVVI